MPFTSYITDSDGLVHTASGWVSMTDTDDSYYDGSTYRNQLSAAYMGNAMTTGGVFGAGESTAFNTDFKSKDDSYNATPPHFTQKKISYRHWVDGSGNVIAAIPIRLLPRMSSSMPTYAS